MNEIKPAMPLLERIYHMLNTDSDLEQVTRPDIYASLRNQLGLFLFESGSDYVSPDRAAQYREALQAATEAGRPPLFLAAASNATTVPHNAREVRLKALKALVDGGLAYGDVVEVMGTAVSECPEARAAKDQYCSGSDNSIEIDDRVMLSEADEGTWVSAWLWIATHKEAA